MDVARGIRVRLRHPRGQVPHDRNDGIARLHRLGREAIRVVQLGAGGRPNGRHAACRHDADICLGCGERRLDFQHGLELGAAAEALRDVRVAQHASLQARAVRH